MTIPAAAEESVAKATKIQSQEFKSAAASELPGEVRPNTILPERVYLEQSDLILRDPAHPGESDLNRPNPRSLEGGVSSPAECPECGGIGIH